MAVTEGQVDVSAAATQIVPPTTDRMPRGFASRIGPTRCIVVKNTGPDTVYVGGTGVAADTGIPISNAGSFTFWVYQDEEIWAICAAAKTATIAYFQSGG